MDKKTLGQFFTKNSVWLTPSVINFIENQNFDVVVDPFAGAGDLLKHFYNKIGYDIDEKLGWPINDSLTSIPKIENALCITNPPYLANYTAKRFKRTGAYDYFKINPEFHDLYQIALKNCLESFSSVVAIVPETFLSSGKFQERLVLINVLEQNPFEDTEFPTLVACWGENPSSDFEVYKDQLAIGKWSDIKICIPNTNVFGLKITFNVIESDIGLIGIDDVKTKRGISFCNKDAIGADEIKVSSRLRTRIKLDYIAPLDIDQIITEANLILNKLRDDCDDVILSPFKGNNVFGIRRRRLDYAMAKKILNQAVFNTHNKKLSI